LASLLYLLLCPKEWDSESVVLFTLQEHHTLFSVFYRPMLRLVGNRLACSSQTSTFVAPGAVAASSAAVSQSRSIHFLYVSNAVTRQKKPMSAEIVEL
jgi:hypothetical protein